MPKLQLSDLSDPGSFVERQIRLPSFDITAARRRAMQSPSWVHFGPGNIFRGYVADLAQQLIERGENAGIAVVSLSIGEEIKRVLRPHDLLSLQVEMPREGPLTLQVIASLSEALIYQDAADYQRLVTIFENPGLQLASMTLTEKAYQLQAADGTFQPVVQADLAGGPEAAASAMGRLTNLLWQRHQAGAYPLTLVSLDNFTHNGDQLRQSVLALAGGWAERGYVTAAFVKWLSDPEQVAFPLTVIDKITPRPGREVAEQLSELGLEDMLPITTSRGSFVAPFTNAEPTGYLVIEDRFANGRPSFDQVGVHLTDRQTVDDFELMKVCTCLNPLHTALAVTGCLLGKPTIAAAMDDPLLVQLVERIGRTEGLPVVVHPGIIDPADFLTEVLTERFPNHNLPDAPQRIATDTSQKVGIRFGRTLQRYLEQTPPAADQLVAIPLVFATWCRYLLGLDDDGEPMALSADPLLAELQALLVDVRLGEPSSGLGKLAPILSNSRIFGVDLVAAGLSERIEAFFVSQLTGPGAVRKTLARVLNS